MFRRFLICAFVSLTLLPAVPAFGADPADTAPALDVSKQNPMPVYPVAARANNERGTAVIYAKVGQTGNVVKVLLAKTSGYRDLDDAALATAKEWHFHPAMVGGNPAEKWTAVGIRFSLVSVKATPEEIDAGFSEEHFANGGFNSQEVVCHNDDAPTGSHLQGNKICHTQKEWDEINNRAKRLIERSINDPSQNHTGGK